MRNVVYGFVVKLSVIVIGFGAFVFAGEFRDDFETYFGSTLTDKFGSFEDSVPRVSGTANETNVSLAPSSSLVLPEVLPGRTPSPIEPPQVSASCEQPANGRGSVVLGDKIRLRFFEMAQNASNAEDVNTASHNGRVAFERLDLSGVYDVAQDGALSLPLVGRVKVAGFGLDCIEPIIERVAFEFMRGGVGVNASFENRPLVIAQGDLRAPGRYDYIPGMTVQHLMSLAGATAPSGATAGASNAPYLVARKSELERAVMGNLVKWYRVSAALDGKDAFRLNDAQFSAIRQVLGTQRIDAEKLALEASMAAKNAADAHLLLEKDTVALLLDQKNKHKSLIKWQVEKSIERHSRLLQQQQRGVITLTLVTEAELTRMSLERMLLETQSQIIELEARQFEVAAAIELQRLRDRQTLALELRNITEEADGLQGQLHAVSLQLGDESDADAIYLAVTIERAGPNSTTAFEATESTLILPGDVVTTTVKRNDGLQAVARNSVEAEFPEKAKK